MKENEHLETENRMLQEQLEQSRKQLAYSRIICVMTSATALILLLFLLFIGPSLSRAADSIANVSGQLEELQLQDLELAETLKDIDEFAITSQEGVEKAIEKLDALDLETLNESIQTLRRVIAPLRSLLGG